jgi:hypothetical protein
MVPLASSDANQNEMSMQFRLEEGEQMTPPTFLPLLNRLAIAEAKGQELYDVWAAHTSDPEFAKCLRFVAIREGEHSMAFTKRMCELGCDRDNSVNAGFKNFEKLLETVKSSASDADKAYHVFKDIDGDLSKLDPSASDQDKAAALFADLFRDTPASSKDFFTSFFADKTIDPQTGALLGRYIAEERDSARRLAITLRAGVGKGRSQITELKDEISVLRAELESLRKERSPRKGA